MNRLIDYVMLVENETGARVMLFAGNNTEIFASQWYFDKHHAQDIAVRTAIDLNTDNANNPIEIKRHDNVTIFRLP